MIAAKEFLSVVGSVLETITPLYRSEVADLSGGMKVPLRNGLVWANDARAGGIVV